MEKELLEFIRENNLSPFNSSRTPLKSKDNSIYKTKDAKSVHARVLLTLSNNFNFSDTQNLFHCFPFTFSNDEISRRQEYFKSLNPEVDSSFLAQLQKPKTTWRPPYGIIVVTEDENIYLELKKLGCPVQLLISDNDVLSLEQYDVVQYIECPQYEQTIERLPQSLKLRDTEEAYLERFVEMLSSWKFNLSTLSNYPFHPVADKIVSALIPLLPLTEKESKTLYSRDAIERTVEKANRELSESVKDMTLSGDYLVALLSSRSLPPALQQKVKQTISSTGLPSQLFKESFPLVLDEDELNSMLRKQELKAHTSIAEDIQSESIALKKVPSLLKDLSDHLLLFDFTSAISAYSNKCSSLPQISGSLNISNSSNIFLENAQPINFHLDDLNRCSILTGANSGGKTTLIEHIIQLISLTQLGLPVSGGASIPLFSEVFYFAKNKGSMDKGAFETLLSQLSSINPSNNALILADEIESVTEPGVAGSIISASASYFISKGCFLVIATHLGKEIQKELPQGARIDGIEAKGLTETFDLIVDHNPVLGRLANSTPELIVEKMAKTMDSSYISFLHEYLKK